MNINRYNYEEYFLLYIDKELDEAECREVEAFVKRNPDLEQELRLLAQTTIVSDDHIVFGNKEALIQPLSPGSFINASNCEECFVRYSDNELSNSEMASVEQFVYANPQYQELFELIQSIQLTPDPSILYPGKERLYRHEKVASRPIFRWWKLAAAAMVLISAGILWLMNPLRSRLPVRDIASEKNIPPAKGKPSKLTKPSPQEKAAEKNDATITPGAVGVQQQAIAQLSEEPRQRKRTRPRRLTVKATDQLLLQEVADTKAGKYQAIKNKPVVPIKPESNTGILPENLPENTVTSSLGSNKNAGSEGKNKKTEIEITAPTIVKEPGKKLAFNSSDNESDENVIFANVPAERKNALRGIFRKASRILDKTTALRPAKRSGISIGNIEIAFQ